MVRSGLFIPAQPVRARRSAPGKPQIVAHALAASRGLQNQVLAIFGGTPGGGMVPRATPMCLGPRWTAGGLPQGGTLLLFLRKRPYTIVTNVRRFRVIAGICRARIQ